MFRRTHTPARLMFVTDTAEAGAGSAEGTDNDAGQSTAGDAPEQKPEPSIEDRFEAQRKVNKDLERKLTEARKAADRASTLEAELAKLQGKEQEYAEAQKAREAEAAALAKANERILRAEVKAAAASKLNDPGDALRLLDLSSFEVGDDGDVDTEAIGAAIDDLIKRKPYLAAEGGRRFQGTADGGTRKESRPAQLTRSDLARLSPEQIVQADAEGRLDDIKRGK